MTLQFAVHVVIVQPSQVIREPLILDRQQPEKAGFPHTLTTHQTEHSFKLASRLEYSLDGSQQEDLHGFASVLVLRSTEKMVQNVGYPPRPIPFQAVQVVPDGMIAVLVGNDADGGAIVCDILAGFFQYLKVCVPLLFIFIPLCNI